MGDGGWELSPEGSLRWKAGATAGERVGRCGKRGTQRASQRQKWRIPKPAHLGVGARSSPPARLRQDGGTLGNSPNLYPYFTSPKWCRNSRPVDVFSLPDLRYAPPPPLEDITFIFQYVVNDTPGHSSESWVNTEEMFLGVRKGGVGCVRTGGNGGVGEEEGSTSLAPKGQASVYLLACFVCLWLSQSR